MSAKTGGVVATRETKGLTALDHQIRAMASTGVLATATAIAVILAMAGVSAAFCASLPFAAYCIPTGIWAWRDGRSLKRRRLARESESTQTERIL